MGLVSGLLLFLGSAACVGGGAARSSNARLRAQSISKSRGTNIKRQYELMGKAYGGNEKHRQDFNKALGRDFPFETATSKDRAIAIWQIAQKEGWVYDRMRFDDLPESYPAYSLYKDTELNKLYKRF